MRSKLEKFGGGFLTVILIHIKATPSKITCSTYKYMEVSELRYLQAVSPSTLGER